MGKFLMMAAFLAACGYYASAVPAYPYPVKIKQPDGTYLTVLMWGDEYFAYNTGEDGYLILRNGKGGYEYAEVDGAGKIIASGRQAHDSHRRSFQEREFIQSFSKEAIRQKLGESFRNGAVKMDRQQKASIPLGNAVGNKKALCILIGFQDKPFTKAKVEISNMLNQTGYSHGNAAGSVKDYFLENSYNQLTLNFTVVGPYVASQNMGYYGANVYNANGIRTGDIRPQALVKEALAKASTEVNFADFDNDNDGEVDIVHVIYAGYSEAAAAELTDAI